jgi:hypothetical protein
MKHFWALPFVLAMILGSTRGVAAQKTSDLSEPMISGTTSGNVGCAILSYHTVLNRKMLAVGVIWSRSEYRVLETFNYNFEKQKFAGIHEIDELNSRAIKDKVKLVVLPAKHAEEQLDFARKACQE